MAKVTINSVEIEVDDGFTVLQACEIAGVEIPRFCYHERLAIAGNCRMCLVEIVGGPPKPVASCAMPIADGMIINTNTEKIKKAREGVLEFLLINHPLDCPICDQGGECDLQDQTLVYGKGIGRFDHAKRAVTKKNFGPLIENMMNRCIHCTRCVRFLADVAGTYELGTVGRGENIEIDTYLSQNIKSELSGNIIDLCPVGALTSKPYSFKARSWELNHCETIDVLDAVGSNIRVDFRGLEVMRVLPRVNEEINEEWISDKTRFSYDGLKLQRLSVPYIRKDKDLVKSTWSEAFALIKEKVDELSGHEIAAVAGDLIDCESILLLKKLMINLGSRNIDCRQDHAKLSNVNRSSYLFNTTINGIQQSDLCLLINTSLRFEAPIINARLRRAYVDNALNIFRIGEKCDNDIYKVTDLGDDVRILSDIYNGKHEFCKLLLNSKNPMMIVGQDALTRDDGDEIHYLASGIAEKFHMIRNDWNGFNVLHKVASRVGALDVGFLPENGGLDLAKIISSVKEKKIKLVYLLGADEFEISSLNSAFVIYQGHHADVGAHNADVILPGAAYTEKNATYVNTEGRVQRTNLALFPPGQAKEDWLIIKELSEYLGFNLGVNSLYDVREELKSLGEQFFDENIGLVIKNDWYSIPKRESTLSLQDPLLRLKSSNFYMTDVISRSSKTMANCVRSFINNDVDVG